LSWTNKYFKMNPMKEIRIEKVTLNIGTGTTPDKANKGIKLLQALSESKPVKTITQKRIPTLGIRPGLVVGCKVTLRGKKAEELLARLLRARGDILAISHFDNQGNFSFGIKEYLDIPDAKYDAEVGIIGLSVAITLERPGSRVKKRKLQARELPPRHKISMQEAIGFVKNKFGIKVEE